MDYTHHAFQKSSSTNWINSKNPDKKSKKWTKVRKSEKGKEWLNKYYNLFAWPTLSFFSGLIDVLRDVVFEWIVFTQVNAFPQFE